MISTAYLKPKNKPKKYYVRHPDDGSPIESTQSHDDRYPTILNQYIELVNRVRRMQPILDSTLAKREQEVIVVRSRQTVADLKRVTPQITAPPPLREKRPYTPTEQAFFRVHANILELKRQMALDQEQLKRDDLTTFSIEELAVYARVSRNALDRAVDDVSKKRWIYRRLVDKYRESRELHFSVLAQYKLGQRFDWKAREAQAISTLFDELELSIPSR